MKKLLTFFLALVVLFSAYTLDLENAENIITGFNNANKDIYIPALVEYGFTEQQIRSWRFTGTNIGIFISQLKPALNGSAIPSPDMYMGTVKAVGEASGELSKQDLEKINLFFHDIADATRQLYDIAQSAKEAERQRLAIESKERQAERQRLTDEANQKRLEEQIADAQRNVRYFSITYNVDENVSGSPPIDNNKYPQNTQVKIDDGNGLKREGYTFTGWATKSGNYYQAGVTIKIDYNMNLYAQWKPNNQSITDTQRQKTESDPHAGMIWVNGYTRKDGTRVKGYWRKK